jgi:hypothetical protein
MKLIEAMKKIKGNRQKIADLQEKIAKNCAQLSHETSPYDDPKSKVREWAQACDDLSRETVELLTRISRTNLATNVTVEISGKPVVKPIAEWIWRRREFAMIDLKTWRHMNDRGLKEGQMQSSTGQPIDVKIVRNYDTELRDKKMDEYSSEPRDIDSALEIANAITDLLD